MSTAPAPAPATGTAVPANSTVRRSESMKTIQPPGAWRESYTDPNADNEQSPIAAIGNTMSEALNAAGNMAVNYLPANVVNQLAAYAPGMVSPKASTNEVTKANSAPPLQATTARGKDIPPHSLTDHPLPEPPANTVTSGNIATTTQSSSPTALSPTSSNLSKAVSTTAVTGHESMRTGIEPPPPSTANTLAPSRDASLPTDSLTPASSIGATTVPSSTISMKSGVIGAGPTNATTAPKDLPSIPSPIRDGVTPRESELEKSDLEYLAPAIRAQDSGNAVPTTQAASRALDKQAPAPVDTTTASRFQEGSSARPTPDSPASAGSRSSGGHSRTGSASSGGSPRRRVTLASRIKGEAKIISGKLTKNQTKVQQGRELLAGETSPPAL